MTTIELKLYSFSELSKKAQQKAIAHYHDINVDYDWWDFTYDDAGRIGIELTGFDVGYRQEIEGKLTESVRDICESILKEHGEQGDTYKVAKKYMEKIQVIVVREKLLNTDEDEAKEMIQQAIEDQIQDDFKKDILQCYWNMLREDYEYRLSDEAVKESIEANDYEFLEDGTVFNNQPIKLSA